MTREKKRLDTLLVDTGLCQTRSQAQGMIMAGKVLVDGQAVTKAGAPIPPDAVVTLKEKQPYVSRGGLKLAHALDAFSVDVTQRVCLDVGASTGGFTDCLLRHGASHVHAVDVGYGQLAWALREDPRVTVWEKTHVNDLDPARLTPLPTISTIDVSFISLKKVLPHVIVCLAGPEKMVVALVKPQFEYKDYCAPKGFDGVVKNLADHRTILTGLAEDIKRLLPGWPIVDITTSPILGPKGNREFFFFLREAAAESALAQPLPSPGQQIVTICDNLEAI